MICVALGETTGSFACSECLGSRWHGRTRPDDDSLTQRFSRKWQGQHQTTLRQVARADGRSSVDGEGGSGHATSPRPGSRRRPFHSSQPPTLASCEGTLLQTGTPALPIAESDEAAASRNGTCAAAHGRRLGWRVRKFHASIGLRRHRHLGRVIAVGQVNGWRLVGW